MRALLVGFGNVGREVARLLGAERSRYPKLAGLRVEVVGIATRSRGGLANPSGVDLRRALAEMEELGCFSPENSDFSALDTPRAVLELEYDVLVELSPLSISDRGEPAASHLREAIRRGRHVVTANKGPLAYSFRGLSRLARERKVGFLFESTVMDGAPVFNLARACLRGCRVLELEGILNSTSNFVLSRLECGDSLAEAVARAQSLGIAEADPNHDLEGWDSAAKICVLANVLMDLDITPLQVRRQGILSVGSERLRAARNRGKRLKLVSRARWAELSEATVALEEFSEDHPFARVEGTGSILKISTDLMTPILIHQEAPGLSDTAYGVLNDLMEIEARFGRDPKKRE